MRDGGWLANILPRDRGGVEPSCEARWGWSRLTRHFAVGVGVFLNPPGSACFGGSRWSPFPAPWGRIKGALVLGFILIGLAASTGPAAADFTLCNNTASRVGVAIGYKDAGGWTTEGWWNLPSRTCETLLKGNLVARYYYVYAVDYDRGGEWMGNAYMCTRDKEFTIRGISNCLPRGYDRTGFFEVDTGQQRAWTVQLTETGEQPAANPLPPGNPLSRIPPAGARAAPVPADPAPSPAPSR
jgi:uncharacterized membrane protein